MANYYVTTADLKTYLNISSSDYDSVIESLENEAVRSFDSKIGHSFISTASRVYTFDAFPEFLILQDYPINSIASITNDGVTVTAADYNLDGANGIVYNLGSYLSNRRKIVVTCDTGYSTANIPSDIKECVKKMVRIEWLRGAYSGNSVGRISRSTPDVSESYRFDLEYEFIENIIQRYMRRVY